MPFDRAMTALAVSAMPIDNQVYIIESTDDEKKIIQIDVDQVDLLIKWLQEAKQSVLTENNGYWSTFPRL